MTTGGLLCADADIAGIWNEPLLESLAQTIASGEIVWTKGLRSIRKRRPPRRYFNSALQSLFAHVIFMVLASVTYFSKNPPGQKRVGLKKLNVQ